MGFIYLVVENIPYMDKSGWWWIGPVSYGNGWRAGLSQSLYFPLRSYQRIIFLTVWGKYGEACLIQEEHEKYCIEICKIYTDTVVELQGELSVTVKVHSFSALKEHVLVLFAWWCIRRMTQLANHNPSLQVM